MRRKMITSGVIFLLFMVIFHVNNFHVGNRKDATVALGGSDYEVVTLVSGLNQPSFIAVDSNYVFFSELGALAIKRVPLYGGSVLTIASGLAGPRSIAVDNDYVYFIDVQYPGQGFIKRVSKGGGSITILASGIGWPFSLTVDEQYVYFTDHSGGTVKRVPKTGGSVTTLASGLSGPRGIAIDANYVYFSDYSTGTGTGTIKKVPKSGGSVATLASGLTAPYYIRIDENYVYFSEYIGSYIKRVAKTGGTVTVLATSANYCYTLEVDEENVYFTEHIIQNYQIIGGNIKKVPKNGGTAIILAENQNYPSGIEKDINFLYYTEVSNGNVRKISKGGDLILESIEPIQVVENTRGLIKDKKTVVRVNVTSTFKGRVWVNIQISYDFTKTYACPGPFGNGTPVDAGKNVIYVPGGPSKPAYQKTWSEEIGWLKWSKTGNDILTCYIDYDGKIPEARSDNNVKSLSIDVVSSRSLRFLVVPVYFPNIDQRWYLPDSTVLRNQFNFLVSTYPVEESKVSWVIHTPLAFNGPPRLLIGNDVLLTAWLYIHVALPLEDLANNFGYDRLVIILDNNGLNIKSWGGCAPGMMRSTFPVDQIPIFVLNSELRFQNELIAHEIGHTFFLWHPHDIGPAVYFAEKYSPTEKVYESLSRTFMSYRSIPPPGFDSAQWHNLPVWIDEKRYEEDRVISPVPIFHRRNLFDSLTVSSAKQSPIIKTESQSGENPLEVIALSFLLYANNSVNFDETLYILHGKPPNVLSGAGNYSIVLLDQNRDVILTCPFNATFRFFFELNGTFTEYEFEYEPFTFYLPLIKGTRFIEIWDSHNRTIGSKTISYNSPMVSVTFPNGGEVLEVGKTYTISWEGYDADGDQLLYSVAYSPDNGETWIPIAFEINQTSITWDTSTLEGGSQYLIKVVATDGVNTAWDVSDRAFSIRKIKGKILMAFKPYSTLVDHVWSFPNGTTFTLRSWLQNKGYDVYADHEVFNNESLTLDQLVHFDAIILADWATQQYPLEVFADYVNIGGGLIFLGQEAHADRGLSEILGFKWFIASNEWGSTYVDAYITNFTHPVMQGITELPKAGGVFVDWDSRISETPLPPNTTILARTYYDPLTDTSDVIALIAFQFGYGRVVAGPWDGLIRPYGPTAIDPWDVICEPVIENKLLLNCIDWVSRGKGGCDIQILEVSFSNPNPRVNETLNIYVKLKNIGMTTVTFDLSLNYTLLIDPLIGTRTLTLAPGEAKTLNFTWTPNVIGRYEIKAYTSSIPEDVNPHNNIKKVYIYVFVCASTSSTDQNEWADIRASEALHYMAYTR